MQESDQPARVPDRLLEPHHGLGGPGAGVFLEGSVFGDAARFVGLRDGEDEEEGVGGTWDEGEEVWAVD